MPTKPCAGRSASANSHDRSRLCSFTFADGRRCRMPRQSGHLALCPFHAEKEAKLFAARQAGEDITSYFYGPYIPACSINGALARVFRGVVRGEIKPKTALALAYIGQTILHAVPLAQNEYWQSIGPQAWQQDVSHYLRNIDAIPDIPDPDAATDLQSAASAAPKTKAPEPSIAGPSESFPHFHEASEPAKTPVA